MTDFLNNMTEEQRMATYKPAPYVVRVVVLDAEGKELYYGTCGADTLIRSDIESSAVVACRFMSKL